VNTPVPPSGGAWRGDPAMHSGSLFRATGPGLANAGAPSPAPSPWLTYREAAAYTGWSVAHLRNLVSAGQVPVFGRPRVRRFRRDLLDLFLTDPDAAMRLFRAERNTHRGR
jgi:excisionase family DNA binding protein